MSLDAINPKVHPRYSPNLYRYLKHPTSAGLPMDVFKNPEGQLWIGRIDAEGWFTGCRLAGVLVSGPTARRDVLAHPPNTFTLVKVPDFWKRYERLGRCAIYPDHDMAFLDSESRYVIKGKTRTCTWCGARHRLHTWIEPVTREKWLPVEPARARAKG